VVPIPAIVDAAIYQGERAAMPTPLSMNRTEWAFLLALSLLWGGSFFFTKIAVAELPPLTVALGRVGIAAAALAVLVRLSGVPGAGSLPGWAAIAVLALFNNVIPFSLYSWAQTEVPSALASILNAMTPIFTVLVAHLATADDKLTPQRGVGLMLGLAGVTVMIGPDILREVGTNVTAQVACLAAALSYAVGGVYGRRFRHIPALRLASLQLTASTVLLAPVALAAERPWTLAAPSAGAAAAIVGVALLSTALAYVIYFRILARAGATNVMLVTFLIPVSAIALGTLLLGEHLTGGQIAGMATIAAGLAAIDGRLPRWLVQRVGTGLSPR
jgi:drug/metabolite transporter (DMT)-like permease